LDETLDYLEKEEKDSLLNYMKKLFTKNIEEDSKIAGKKKAVMDKALRDRLLSLGYISSSDNAYSEPMIELKKTAEFSSIELLKYSSLGFEKFRDPLSDIGFSLKSEIQFENAIVLPVIELQPDDFNLIINYSNSASDSKVNIQTYQYFSGIEIEKKSLDLEKSDKVREKSIILSGKSEKIIIVLRFYTDDNLRIMGIKIKKS
jgi:hypothetical protein